MHAGHFHWRADRRTELDGGLCENPSQLEELVWRTGIQRDQYRDQDQYREDGTRAYVYAKKVTPRLATHVVLLPLMVPVNPPTVVYIHSHVCNE